MCLIFSVGLREEQEQARRISSNYQAGPPGGRCSDVTGLGYCRLETSANIKPAYSVEKILLSPSFILDQEEHVKSGNDFIGYEL